MLNERFATLVQYVEKEDGTLLRVGCIPSPGIKAKAARHRFRGRPLPFGSAVAAQSGMLLGDALHVFGEKSRNTVCVRESCPHCVLDQVQAHLVDPARNN
jgi:hypothetical protein